MVYKPIQFNKELNYQESKASAGLVDKITCYWEIQTTENPIAYRIIPDGCIDFVINCTIENNFFICPIMKESNFFHLSKNETWFGIRFYPGVLSTLLQIDLNELQHDTLELKLINPKLHKRLDDVLIHKKSFDEKTKALNTFFSNELNFKFKRIFEIIQVIYKTRGAILLKDYSSKTFSLSERQIRRLFHKEVGLAPKKFASIIRNQSLLRELQNNKETKAYYELYFDQSHMIREMKKLTGLTPKQILHQLNS